MYRLSMEKMKNEQCTKERRWTTSSQNNNDATRTSNIDAQCKQNIDISSTNTILSTIRCKQNINASMQQNICHFILEGQFSNNATIQSEHQHCHLILEYNSSSSNTIPAIPTPNNDAIRTSTLPPHSRIQFLILKYNSFYNKMQIGH